MADVERQVVAVEDVAWWRRSVVSLSAGGSLLGAIGWWSSSDRSVGFTGFLAVLVLGAVVPAFVLGSGAFRKTCLISGGSLALIALVTFPLLLFWSFLSGVVLLLVATVDHVENSKSKSVLGILGLLIAVAVVAVLLPADIRLWSEG